MYCLDGGTAAVVVEFGDGGHIAGPQATLSPIGRGAGWGSVGRPDRRRRIADLLGGLLRGEIDDVFGPQMRASVDAMSVSAEDVVLIIPDRREFDDERRDQLLKCLEGPRRPSIRLLWRPVAVALSMLESGRLPIVREGLRIVCLDHSDDGIERQKLLLRELPKHPGVFAPERAGYGGVVGRSAGLSALMAECDEDCKLELIDLMPVNAAVPANREYVSEPIRSFSWPARVKNVEFYIRKAGEFRKWRTEGYEAPE